MARLASTCWRLALGAQLRFLDAMPLCGQSAAIGADAANAMAYTIAMIIHVSLTSKGDRLKSFPHSGWTKLARAETRLLVTSIRSRWIILARLGLTCWRLALGAQLPISGRSAAIWAERSNRGRLPLFG